MRTFCFVLLLLAGSFRLHAETDPGYAGLSPRDRHRIALSLPGVRVNTYNGNLMVTVPLFLLPGIGLPLECYLVHNSDHRAISSPFGRGWSFSYHVRYLRHGNGDVTIAWGSGRQDRFIAAARSGGGFSAPAGLYMELSEPVAGQLLLRDKHGICFLFEEPTHQKLTAVRDPNGNQISLDYTLRGALQTITDASGRLIRLFYDGPHLARLQDTSLGREYLFSYDGQDRLTGITDPLGQTLTYGYDAAHLLTALTDRRGATATISYATPPHHAGTRLPATIVKDVSTTAFAYDPVTRQTTVTDARGNDWRYSYDVLGRAVALRDPALETIGLAWDGANNLASATDRNGSTHTYTYDGLGNRLSHSDPLGQLRSWSYEPLNCRMASYTDRNANSWAFVHDGSGNLTTIIDPLTNQTEITYDGLGQPVSSTNPALETTLYGHDGNGNLTSVTDPLGGIRTHTYDAAGREVGITDANGNATGRVFDALDRLTLITDALAGQTLFAYDGESNILSRTDTRGFTSTFSYDPLGRLIAVEDALGNSETYGYDAMGNRTAVTDRRGNTTLFDYDPLGRLIERTTPLGTSWLYGYDNEGNLTARTDPLGQTIDRTYDALGRVTSRTLPGPIVTTYGYDANGNLTSASKPGSTITSTYDALNRLASRTDVDLAKTLTLAHDANGNIQKAVRPDGDTQLFEYDANNRLSRITADGQVFDFEHDPGGRRTLLERPGPLTTSYVYDGLNRITSQETSDGLDTLSHDYVYTADQLIETREDGSANTMTFDALNRMVRDVRSGTPTYDFQYGYDANDNMTGNSGTTPFFPNDPLAFTYNANNQVITETGTDFGGAYTRTYSYDDNGNLTRKLGVGISTATFVYDALNRLVSATDSGVGTEIYTYDALDRLRSIEVPSPAPGELGFQRFFYDQDNRIIVNYDMAGAIQEQYWHNHGGTVLFSTMGGIDPIAPSPLDAGFAGALAISFPSVADDFTRPGFAWEIETPAFPKSGSSRTTNAGSGLDLHRSRSIPAAVLRLLEELKKDKLHRFPDPPGGGRLLGHPGYLGNQIAPVPPRDPGFGFPRLPDGYLLRKVALTLFFLLQDPYGNVKAGVVAGLAGLLIQVYDLFKRIVIGGNPGPFGPGGDLLYRPRINALLFLSGSACDNYTSFRCNQPNMEEVTEIDRLGLEGVPLGAVDSFFDIYHTIRL